jgi:hypothetical protein
MHDVRAKRKFELRGPGFKMLGGSPHGSVFVLEQLVIKSEHFFFEVSAGSLGSPSLNSMTYIHVRFGPACAKGESTASAGTMTS